MRICAESAELDIYNVSAIKDLIEFKWQSYARNFHVFGILMHFWYMFTIILYVKVVYIDNSLGDQGSMFTIVLGAGLGYPTVYETYEMLKRGNDYWKEIWNYTDFIFVWSGVLNIGLQNIMSPFSLYSRASMLLLVFMLLIKTVLSLRIFEGLSYIVTMLKNVVYDLRIFLFFYGLITVLFSLIIGILGIGNFRWPDSNFTKDNDPDEDGYFGYEYRYIGLFLGNIA